MPPLAGPVAAPSGGVMDIDRFLSLHRPDWDRLAQLTRMGERGAGRLTGAQLEELVSLYQRTSGHLSYAQTYFADPGLVIRLSQLVGAAGAVIYGTRARTVRGFGRFFTRTFPAAMWHIRRFVLVSALLTFIPAIGLG